MAGEVDSNIVRTRKGALAYLIAAKGNRMTKGRHCRSIAAVALVLVAGMAGGAIARERPPIKSIGIVSDIGDKVRLQHIGFMVFGNSLVEKDMPEWQIDAFMTGELEAALKGRYELRAVTFAKGSIAPDLAPKLFSGPSPDKNLQANAKPADGQPIDAYVVLWPHRGEVYPTNQYVTGLGLLTQGGRASIYAKVAITLVDGRTFEEIDSCLLRVSDDSTDINRMRKRDDLNVESFEAMTPEQMQGFEQGVKALLRDGLNFCLGDTKLVP